MGVKSQQIIKGLVFFFICDILLLPPEDCAIVTNHIGLYHPNRAKVAIYVFPKYILREPLSALRDYTQISICRSGGQVLCRRCYNKRSGILSHWGLCAERLQGADIMAN